MPKRLRDSKGRFVKSQRGGIYEGKLDSKDLEFSLENRESYDIHYTVESLHEAILAGDKKLIGREMGNLTYLLSLKELSLERIHPLLLKDAYDLLNMDVIKKITTGRALKRITDFYKEKLDKNFGNKMSKDVLNMTKSYF